MATVSRWRRYGKDRLYVTGEDGTKLGYRDLLTGVDHVERPERLAEFHAALGDWAEVDGPLDAGADPVGDLETAHGVRVADEAGLSAGQPVGSQPQPSEEPLSAVESAGERPAATPAPPAGVEEAGWEDLAGRRAGAMAREQAQALKQAAPVRTFLARVLGVHTKERAWRIGADGEEKVAVQLEKLACKDSRWRFVHAIPVGE